MDNFLSLFCERIQYITNNHWFSYRHLFFTLIKLFIIGISKGVTMAHFFFKCKKSCWLKVYRFIWMIENEILKNFIFYRQNCFGVALFPPLVKAKNQHQNFEKHLKQKRCRIRCLNVTNLYFFLKKYQINMVKNIKKTARNTQFST